LAGCLLIKLPGQDAGLETEVQEFQVYLSTPRSIRAELLELVDEPLNVREPANPLDPDSSNPELTSAFVAYSASGDVRATVVYVNYGLPPDTTVGFAVRVKHFAPTFPEGPKIDRKGRTV
jgi:hypothetical protein